jgi:uncharacterized alkaline shock family protein YloU
MTGSTAVLPEAPGTGPGRTELGTISINDRVVEKMAARASALGARQTSLTDLPKTSAEVDGSRVILDLSISVRWPASVPEVSDAVREHIRSRVGELTGLIVTEVFISVTALVTQLPAPPRVQ